MKYNIFRRMSFFKLPEIQARVPKAQVGEVMLYGRVDIFLTLYVVSDSAVNQKGIAQILGAALYGRLADGLMLDALDKNLALQPVA